MTVISNTKAIVRVFFGLLNAAAGVFFLVLEYRQPPTHTTHIAIFAAWISFGLAVMWPSLFFPTWQKILVMVPIDWKLNGLRKTDPQSPPPNGLPSPDPKTPPAADGP